MAKKALARKRGGGIGKAPKVGAGLKSFRELAESEGYLPGLFMLRRQRDNIERITQWRKALDRGEKPRGMEDMKMGHCWRMYYEEAADVAKSELAFLDFIWPKLKASEEKVEMDQSLVVNVTRFSGDDEDGS